MSLPLVIHPKPNLKMPKVAIIYNPKAGHQSRGQITSLKRQQKLRGQLNEPLWQETLAPGHATSLAQILKTDAELIIAIGGDGTVNEVGTGLLGTDTTLGIFPVGSGNGLAKELHLPRHPNQAARVIAQNKTSYIDILEVNGQPVFNMAGIGFDAAVAHQFAQLPRRGFWNYVRATLSTLRTYKPIHLELVIDDQAVSGSYFLGVFANSRQYGNNAYIAPQAQLNDGFIDVGLIKTFPWYAAPVLLLRLFTGSIHHSRYYHSFKAKKINILNREKVWMHMDGEVRSFTESIRIGLHQHKLKVLTGH